MVTPSRRRIALWGGVLAVLLVLAGVACYLLLPARQSAEIAVPSDTATPEEVVHAYLEALNAHDCDTAETLMPSDAATSAGASCEDVSSIDSISVGEAFDSTGQSTTEEVFVPVTFDLQWRPFHNDTSLGDGSTEWGYVLTRASADAPWRIFDQGAA